jgi:hypothetical protein
MVSWKRRCSPLGSDARSHAKRSLDPWAAHIFSKGRERPRRRALEKCSFGHAPADREPPRSHCQIAHAFLASAPSASILKADLSVLRRQRVLILRPSALDERTMSMDAGRSSLRWRIFWPLTNPVANRDRKIARRLRGPGRPIRRAFASCHSPIHTHPVGLHLSDRFAYVAMCEPDKASKADHRTNQNCYRQLDHNDRRNLARFAIDSARTSRLKLSGSENDVRA